MNEAMRPESAFIELRDYAIGLQKQRDELRDRCKAYDRAILKFKIAFKRYARREHSDAHVLQPAVDDLTAVNPQGESK